MRLSLTAAIAGLGLTMAGCNQTPAADPAFGPAASFACEGGGKLDVAFGYPDGVKIRLDGGPARTLVPAAGDNDRGGMRFQEGDTALVYEMDDTMTYESGGAKQTCLFRPESLPAPTVAGVAHALTVADAGSTVEVKIGEKISVTLVGVPTAGYVWAAASPPAWVKASDGPGGATSTAQLLPGFAGGNHWEIVVIEAVAAGEGEIVLAQRRPWEDAAEPDAATFKFTLKAS